MTAEIFILNYNGKNILAECLPSIVEAAKRASYPCKVSVIDNNSSDGSEDFLRQNFSNVNMVGLKTNRVLCAFNDAVSKSSADVVFLLNNDLKVEPNFIDPLVKIFERKSDAFFAAPRSLNYVTGEYEGSLSKLELRQGLLWGTARFKGHEKKIGTFGISMQCGFGAFRRSSFMELGGYDDLYLPGTVEDSDLCFRAWRRGWKGYYSPESVVYHMGQVSFKRAFGASGIKKINRRNLYFFIWKNIRNPYLMAQHIFFLPFHTLKYIIFGQWDFLWGLGDAVKRLPEALAKRRGTLDKEPSRISDLEIFSISKGI